MDTIGHSLSDLQSLQSDSAYYQDVMAVDSFRLKAVKQAGEELGMQTALANESIVIDNILAKHAYQLDQVFNFRLLMDVNGVLPPVIISANHQLQISDDGNNIRVGGKVYRIIQQVRFVTTPPTWRDYLWMNYPYPEPPSPAVLPQNSAEQRIWSNAVIVGWKEGIQQALDIYHINLDHLSQDYNGMILYKELLAQNMVSPFNVIKQNNGITASMRIKN